MHQLKTLKNGIIIKVFLCLKASITVCLCAYVFVFPSSPSVHLSTSVFIYCFLCIFHVACFSSDKTNCLLSDLDAPRSNANRDQSICHCSSSSSPFFVVLNPLVLSSLFFILWSFLHCSSFSGYFFILLSFLPPPTHDFTSNYLI